MRTYSTKNPSTELVQIRCTPADKLAWQRAAAAKGLQLGSYIKYVLEKEAANTQLKGS